MASPTEEATWRAEREAAISRLENLTPGEPSPNAVLTKDGAIQRAREEHTRYMESHFVNPTNAIDRVTSLLASVGATASDLAKPDEQVGDMLAALREKAFNAEKDNAQAHAKSMREGNGIASGRA